MVSSLSLLSCESSVSVKEKTNKKKNLCYSIDNFRMFLKISPAQLHIVVFGIKRDF